MTSERPPPEPGIPPSRIMAQRRSKSSPFLLRFGQVIADDEPPKRPGTRFTAVERETTDDE